MDLTVQLAATQGLVPSSRTVVTKSALGSAKGNLILTMHDEDVGAILGKKGQTLTSVQQNAKVGTTPEAWLGRWTCTVGSACLLPGCCGDRH